MSPPVEEGIGAKVPFFSLHSLLASGTIQSLDYTYPFYVIESTRFFRVLAYLEIPLTREELEYLAKKAGCL